MPPPKKKTVVDWNARFDEQNHKFDEILSQNNKLIELLTRVLDENATLRLKVENLEKIVCEKHNPVKPVVAEENAADIVADSVHELVETVASSTKTKFDVLILSDSIYRHVGVPVPKDRNDTNPHPSTVSLNYAKTLFPV